jgi:hypothetical protein
LGQKKDTEGHLTLRQKVESEILNLDRNLAKAKKLDEKFRLLAKSEREIRVLRKKTARQDERDEIFFDQFLAVLGEIPRSPQFKREQCGEYRTTLVAHFEPTAEGNVQNQALKYGLQVLDEICDSKNR